MLNVTTPEKTEPKSTESPLWSNRKVLHVEGGKERKAVLQGGQGGENSSHGSKSRIERFLSMEEES